MTDITKPLKRFQMIRVKGNKNIKVTLKYERLPHFCFLCGMLSHTEKDCSNVADEDKESGYGWGMDIRASPRKGLSKNKEEIDALKLKKSLFVTKPSPPPSVSTKEKNNSVDVIGGSGLIVGIAGEKITVEDVGEGSEWTYQRC